MHYQQWEFEVIDHVARMRINRPASMNSLDAATLDELEAIAKHIQTNPDIWMVVLEGKGDHFSVGVDTSAIFSLPTAPKATFKEGLRHQQHCIDTFEAIKKPKIAKIQGYCIGGGMILAACCDFRIVAENAQFSLPEVKLGIAVIMGTYRITRLVGVAKVKEMILLGDFFKAAEAQQYGLVSALVKPDALEETVQQWIAKLKVSPPRTLAIANQIIDEGLSMDLQDSQRLEVELQTGLLGSPDWQEAIQSFSEKRKGNYQGI
ncbi:MAG TPA: enoyl-CoA hydratase/isomerase family protein [Microscillaceae bacterium]|jgi:enoyl-CoA hydratase/carnithine racemase|nr:enoyl-CoA hydratase/isomerase family protein [Microscillaceae bacterium]